MLLTGTTQLSLPSSSPLRSILMDRGPLGGETTAHTAPWLRLSNLHVRFTVCMHITMIISKKKLVVLKNYEEIDDEENSGVYLA